LVRDDKAGSPAVGREHSTHQRSDSLTIEMPPGGGLLARFSKP
jgi:hypothetical protein